MATKRDGSGMVVARVEALHRYAVKGMRGRGCERAAVALHGLAGDRRWVVVDPGGRFLTQRQLPGMARFEAEPGSDGLLLRHGNDACRVPVPGADAPGLSVSIWGDAVPALAADEASADWISARLGRPCRLAFMADERARPVDPAFAEPGDHVGFSDAYPLLLASAASLRALNEALATPVPMDRFRPSVTVDGFAPWAEDSWRRVRIGAVTFRAPKPCTRCVVITHDQRSGETPDPGEPLRTLGRLNRHPSGIVFGANLIPEQTGWLAVGDAVEVLEAAG